MFKPFDAHQLAQLARVLVGLGLAERERLRAAKRDLQGAITGNAATPGGRS
jgi:hypothetical protein